MSAKRRVKVYNGIGRAKPGAPVLIAPCLKRAALGPVVEVDRSGGLSARDRDDSERLTAFHGLTSRRCEQRPIYSIYAVKDARGA